MKKVYILLIVLLFIEFLLIATSVALYFIAYNVIIDTSGSVTARQSNSGAIRLIVEGAPAPTPPPAPSPGAGGGSSTKKAGPPKIASMSVVPKEINVLLIPGEQAVKEISVSNTGETNLLIDAGVIGVNENVGLNLDRLVLQSKESENVVLTIVAPNEPGIYPGKIIFKSGNLEEEVNLLVNVKSPGVLFDSSIDIPEDYKTIRIGERLRIFVSLTQVGVEIGQVVTINYFVKDFDGNVILTESEEIEIINKHITFEKVLIIPELFPGIYVAGFEVIHESGIAPASETFTVIEERIFIDRDKIDVIFVVIISLIILIILLITWAIFKYKKAGRRKVKSKRKKRKRKNG